LRPEAIDLEALLTSPDGFGLTTATPCQRAWCRASTGVPLGNLANDSDVQRVFGGASALSKLPVDMPRLLLMLAGVRSAKSKIAAARAFRASQIVNVDGLGDGDGVRISLVSVHKDQATAVWDHLLGALLNSDVLGRTVARWPANGSLWLWHPTGRQIEVKVVAGSRAGATLVSRWSAGVVFDEAAKMVGRADGAVINLEDALDNLPARMRPGAQIDLISSPWAPFGPVYELALKYFGRPSLDCLALRAPGPLMNPGHFTPEFCAELERTNPRNYKTDVLCEFADLEDALLSSVDVQACTRAGPDELERAPRNNYSAAIDPATRGNGWTLTIVTSDSPGRYRTAVARQWKGTAIKPLSPRQVLREIAVICGRYGVDTLSTDQWSIDALRDIAEEVGLQLREYALNPELWRTMAENLRVLVAEHRLELPDNPTLRADLLGIQRRLTAQSWTPALASTTGDNRHSDYVPSLCLALLTPPEAPSAEVPSEFADADEERICNELAARADDPFAGAFARWQ